MFYLLKNLLLSYLKILKQSCNNIFYFNLVFMCFVCVFVHSCFIENPLIWILKDRPLISEVFLSQKLAFTNFSKTHHMLESSRAMPSFLGGFTSKSNKRFTDAWCSPKCSRFELKCSHTKLSEFWALWLCQDHHIASLFIVRWPILKR
jgi:hypothetical protein